MLTNQGHANGGNINFAPNDNKTGYNLLGLGDYKMEAQFYGADSTASEGVGRFYIDGYWREGGGYGDGLHVVGAFGVKK